jgi:hypothetical protein
VKNSEQEWQTSSENSKHEKLEWWARGDSDARPTGYEPGALTGLSYGPMRGFSFYHVCF